MVSRFQGNKNDSLQKRQRPRIPNAHNPAGKAQKVEDSHNELTPFGSTMIFQGIYIGVI